MLERELLVPLLELVAPADFDRPDVGLILRRDATGHDTELVERAHAAAMLQRAYRR
jgi:hypothetical protein